MKRKWRNRGTQFLRAAAAGDLETLRQLAAQRVHPDIQLRPGWTALHAAARHGQAEAVRVLLRLGAGRDIADHETGMTPLHLAASNGHVDAARELLDDWADTEICDRVCRTPLTCAAAAGATTVACLLLEHGAHVDSSCDDWENYWNRARVDPDRCAEWNPLEAAVVNGHQSVVRLLVDHGADLDASYGDSGHTALMLAALLGRTEIVRLLVECGADVNAKAYGLRVLELLINEEQYEMAGVLRDLGAKTRDG